MRTTNEASMRGASASRSTGVRIMQDHPYAPHARVAVRGQAVGPSVSDLQAAAVLWGLRRFD